MGHHNTHDLILISNFNARDNANAMHVYWITMINRIYVLYTNNKSKPYSRWTQHNGYGQNTSDRCQRQPSDLLSARIQRFVARRCVGFVRRDACRRRRSNRPGFRPFRIRHLSNRFRQRRRSLPGEQEYRRSVRRQTESSIQSKSTLSQVRNREEERKVEGD